jgi:large subunit ribosomal protein L31
MKASIHPKYYEQAQVICVCGNRFTTGSTQEIIRVELCNNCHPFYTGQHKFVDSGSLIKKFQNKQQAASQYQQKKVKKTEEKKKSKEGQKTLREMLMGLK